MIVRRRPKDLLPKSLYGRAMLIIVAPIALMQIAVTWAFFDAHWETVTSRLSESVAGDIAVALDLYEQEPSLATVARLQPFVTRTMGISMELEREASLPTTVRSSFFRVLDRTLRSALSAKLDHAFWFDTTRYPAYVDIRVQVEAGVLRLVVPRDRVFATTGHIFLVWIGVATILLTGVSLIYIRNQAKPIERLAAAAERFGRGQDAPAFRPAGAREVRQAAQAFLKMRSRIQRHIDQRTTILAGVSHDLRTPLTRFKLQLALMPEGPDKQAMLADVADMQAILNEYLDFARGVGGEEPQPTDLAALVQDVSEQAVSPVGEAAHPVSAVIEDLDEDEEADFTLTVRAAAVKRCLENLVSNAVKHGEAVRISARRTATAVEIDVDDDGPGIPEAQREAVFKPFHRIEPEWDDAEDAGVSQPVSGTRLASASNGSAGAPEPARNPKTARQGGANRMGVGLGLAMARDVARSHGGDILLFDSPMGGLRARLRLPV